MLGMLITIGVGAVAFKLGMNAQGMYEKGCTTPDVAKKLASDAIDTVSDTVDTCYGVVASVVDKVTGGPRQVAGDGPAKGLPPVENEKTVKN